MSKRNILLFGWIVLLTWAQPVQAGPRDFLIAMSGFLGTTEQAQPILSKLFRRLEQQLGWPADSINGAYFPDPESGLQYLKQQQPGFALVTFEMYQQQRQALKMQVIGGMRLAEGAMSRFHVVAKKQGGPTKLSELAGKSIASPHLAETRFAERVLLGGELSFGSGPQAVKAVPVAAPLAALRQVVRGQVDAALVDEPVVAQLSKLPFGSELAVIHSSPELPPLPIVSLRYSTAADRQPMAKALLSLCEGEEGASLCRSMRLEKVLPATDRTFADVLRLLSR